MDQGVREGGAGTASRAGRRSLCLGPKHRERVEPDPATRAARKDRRKQSQPSVKRINKWGWGVSRDSAIYRNISQYIARRVAGCGAPFQAGPLVAAEAPTREVRFGDGLVAEAFANNGRDLGEVVEPVGDRGTGLAVGQTLVDLVTDSLGEAGDFGGARHRKG